MAMKKVWIEDGCIGCGLCEVTAPEVFEMIDGLAEVKEGADFNASEEGIKESADACPVEVIKYE